MRGCPPAFFLGAPGVRPARSDAREHADCRHESFLHGHGRPGAEPGLSESAVEGREEFPLGGRRFEAAEDGSWLQYLLRPEPAEVEASAKL